jgi:hypothetical protein
MGRSGWLVTAAALGLALRAVPGEAQQPEGATIVGVVRDASSSVPVRGALVSVGERGQRRALTDSLGAFRIEDVPLGSQTVRVQRFGYRALEQVVPVSAGLPPQELRLEPDPLQLQGLTVTSVELPLSGVVRDAGSGAPVPWAELELSRDAVREEGRDVADLNGDFSIRDVPTGAYFLLVEKLGYESQYVMVGHTSPAQPIEVRLHPDTAIQRGLAYMATEMTRRRNASSSAVRFFDESDLRLSRDLSLREFLEQEGSTVFAPCGRMGELTCVRATGGRLTMPRVYIDDMMIVDGAGALRVYDPAEMHSLELFRCGGTEIRIYTSEYMYRLARRPRIVTPACLPW